ncbi:MAG: hypothetical protein IPJ79_10405 [Bacteroidetes bacterium]|nr:hypothetical protein [Bacteroidota bacterium]
MKRNLLLLLVCGLFISVSANANFRELKVSKAENADVVTSTDTANEMSPCDGDKCKKGDKCCKNKDSKASAKKAKGCSSEGSSTAKSCCMKKDKGEAKAENKEDIKEATK